MNLTPLEQVMIDELPSIIGFAKSVFKAKNPDAPEPTSEQVIAAFNTAGASSLAVDDNWLAAHPPEADPPTE